MNQESVNFKTDDQVYEDFYLKYCRLMEEYQNPEKLGDNVTNCAIGVILSGFVHLGIDKEEAKSIFNEMVDNFYNMLEKKLNEKS